MSYNYYNYIPVDNDEIKNFILSVLPPFGVECEYKFDAQKYGYNITFNMGGLYPLSQQQVREIVKQIESKGYKAEIRSESIMEVIVFLYATAELDEKFLNYKGKITRVSSHGNGYVGLIDGKVVNLSSWDQETEKIALTRDGDLIEIKWRRLSNQEIVMYQFTNLNFG